MTGKKESPILQKEFGVWTLLYEHPEIERSRRLSRWFEVIVSIARSIRDSLFTNSGDPPDVKSYERVPIKDDTEELVKTLVSNRFRHLCRFVQEVYSLGPMLFYLHIASETLSVVDSTVNLYASNKLVETTSRCLDGGACRASQIVYVLSLRIVVACISQFFTDQSYRRTAILKNRVTHYFRLKAIRVAARFDLDTCNDPITRAKMSSFSNADNSDAYDTFVEIWTVCFSFIQFFSSASLVVGIAQSRTMIVLSIILCLIDPLSELLTTVNKSLYSMSFFSYCTHEGFNKMSSLRKLAYSPSFREDMLNNNAADFIIREYEKEAAALADIRTDGVEYQWTASLSLWHRIYSNTRSDFPDILLALVALYRPSSLSIASLITLKQTSQNINGTVSLILYQLKYLASNLKIVDDLYTMEDIKNKIKDGDRPYPSDREEEPLQKQSQFGKGAKLEFRNVSFRYPGVARDALSDISFTIQPGQLVVIVGVNGSGKSSTVKLLTRLHDPTGGEILLDDHPLPSYKLDDIRRCVAVLRQDHPILPVSLGENVALGLAERPVTDAQVQEAVRQGGAAHLISKQTRGLDTVLHPNNGAWTHIQDEEKHKELKAIADAHTKQICLSGGETQRISAARTFMRLMGGDIRLLVADEPTSALDPEGEFELFTRFREHTSDKTVIFITHRFGHLTRHADLILCFKDGKLIESGKHDDLVALDGEYKKLHSVQAHAFI